MFKLILIVSVSFSTVLGKPFELFGSGVPRTGNKWPPFPHAGEDLWALQAASQSNMVAAAKPSADEVAKRLDNEPVAEPEPQSSLMEKATMKKMTVMKNPVQYYQPQMFVPMVQYHHLQPPMLLYG